MDIAEDRRGNDRGRGRGGRGGFDNHRGGGFGGGRGGRGGFDQNGRDNYDRRGKTFPVIKLIYLPCVTVTRTVVQGSLSYNLIY